MKLKEKIENLPDEFKKIFEEIFSFQYFSLNLEDDFYKNTHPDLIHQEILWIKNKILETEVIYSPFRKRRGEPIKQKSDLNETTDPFCNFLTQTPPNFEGQRKENEKAVLVGNLTKIVPYHDLVIFKKHNPFEIEEDDFLKATDLVLEWFQRISKKGLVRLFLWNFNYRAGASILHPHFQLLALPDLPLKMTKIQKIAVNNKDYFEKIKKISTALDLTITLPEVQFSFDLTPPKDGGATFEINFESETSRRNLWIILKSLISLGIDSFNLLIIFDEPCKNLGFFVERGQSQKLNSDIGAMEMFLLPVITTDPVELSENLRNNLLNLQQ